MKHQHETALSAATAAVLPQAQAAKRAPSAAVREMCGGVSDMTLWRWLNDPALNFPKPIYIGRRRYWREAEVIAWLDALPAQASEAA